MTKAPLLSIITVNYNNNAGLKKTIECLKKQSFSNYEHIIIDAGSTDGSKETILDYAKDPEGHLVHWVSEPDKGIYDGMNKGIDSASGDYLYFLNSGDILTDDVLAKVPFDGTQYIYGYIKIVFSPTDSMIWNYPDTFDTFFLANPKGWLSQQACFIHRSLFTKHKYNTDYKIISDWIHAVRCILFEGCSYKYIPLLIAEYDGNGVSANQERVWEERRRWIRENVPAAFFKAFVELDRYQQSGMTDMIEKLSKTTKLKTRVKKLVSLLYRLDKFFLDYKFPKGAYVLYDYQIFDLQHFGGISRYHSEIMRRLNLSYDVAIRYSINYYLTKWHLGKHLVSLPRFIYNSFCRYFEKKNFRLSKKALRRGGDYLLHPTYYSPYFLQEIDDHPYVVTIHDMIYEKFSDNFADSKEMVSNKAKIAHQAARIIAVSENTKKDIVEIMHIDPRKIDVIYLGTSMKPVSRYKLKLPEKFLLYVGARTPYKNFERFIHTFSILAKEDSHLQLICTDKQFKPSEKLLLESLGIADRTIHIKATDRDMIELYCRAGLFVYPSLYEGFGIPILEAYACHCPVVLSNTSCFPEIAGEAGCYFDPYSEESMAEAIHSVLYDEKKRQELIQKGDERLKRYSWEKAAKETEEVYRKVINETKSHKNFCNLPRD